MWDYARRGEARFVRDLELEDIPHIDRSRVRKYRTFITVPILLDEEPAGLLTINAPEPGDLAESDVVTMFAIADLIAAALRQVDGKFPSKGA